MPVQIRNPDLVGTLRADFPLGWVPIYQEELAAPGTFTINPPIPNTYRNLALFCQLRSDAQAELDYVALTFNNDGGANYVWACKYAQASNAFAATGSVAPPTYIRIATIEAISSRANNYTPFTIWIPGYKFDDREKWAYCSNSGAFGNQSALADLYIVDCRGTWRSQNAITRIDLDPLNGTNFAANSRVELYGIL